MKRHVWTKLGIIELGALAMLWRSVKAAPLVAVETDLERPAHRYRRAADRDRQHQQAV